MNWRLGRWTMHFEVDEAIDLLIYAAIGLIAVALVGLFVYRFA